MGQTNGITLKVVRQLKQKSKWWDVPPFGRNVFEMSLQQVVRLWVGTGHARDVSQWMCFAEISQLCCCINLAEVAANHCLASFTPSLFQEILLPTSSINLVEVAANHCLASFMPALFQEILLPTSSIMEDPNSVRIESISPDAKEQLCALLSAQHLA